MTGHFVNIATGEPNFPPGNRTNWNGLTGKEAKNLYEWMRTLGFTSHWNPLHTCMLGFTSRPNDMDAEAFLEKISQEVASIDPNYRYEIFRNRPVAVDSSPKDRLMETLAHRPGLCIYDHNLQKEKVFRETRPRERET